MSGTQAPLRKSMSCFIRILSLLSGFIFLLSGSILCDIPVIIPLHFLQKYLPFFALTLFEQVLVQKVQNILAHFGQLLLDHLFIIFGFLGVLSRSFFIFFPLDQRNDSPGCSPGSDHILECDRQNISLVDCKFIFTLLRKL